MTKRDGANVWVGILSGFTCGAFLAFTLGRLVSILTPFDTAGPLVTAVIWVLSTVATSVLVFRYVEESKAKEAARKRQEENKRESDAARERHKHAQGIADAAIESAQEAHCLGRTIQDIERFDKSFDIEAREHFANGAFSPFWSVVETRYSNWACWRQSVEQIRVQAIRHAEAIMDLADMNMDPSVIADFPFSKLDRRALEKRYTQALASLDALVYQAQTDPTFAMVWKQRRTTQAVVAGFANLEKAVCGMRSAVIASIGQLDRTITTSSHASVQAIAAASADQNREVLALTTQQTEVLRTIKSDTARMRQELPWF